MKSRLFFAMLALCISFAALACKDASSEAAERGKPGAGEVAKAVEAKTDPVADKKGAAAGAADTDKGDANAPSVDIYPDFNFGLLSASERTNFVKIAEAELCPCPGATNSLHECLQKPDRCGLSTQIAGVVGMSIKEGLGQTDTLDRVARFVEASKRSYVFGLEGVPVKGGKNAKVVIVEFADFQCPHCRDAGKMLDEINKKYGDQVAIYFKQFPLGRAEGQLAAQASLAAHKQGKFWPMHDILFQNQHVLSRERIERFAQQLGLNFERFKKDMNSPEIVAQVTRERKEGEAANLSGTPAIFINGRSYLDDKTTSRLIDAIDAELAAAAQQEKAAQE
ncbi:MAG: thioredoxin domain-containing protein [Bradymonadaceae bacterium]|nr:thioredoxin domain-containing protein [Lujinxingiaceae bacterium]